MNLKETLSQRTREKIKNNVGEFLVEQTLDAVSSEKSPVSGESWPKLRKGPYRDRKAALNGNTRANMELEGDMLDSLKFRKVDEGIEIGFFNSEAAKADGHNKFSGRENNAPKRRFLPKTGQNYSQEIRGEIKKIALDAIADSQRFGRATFEGISTRNELFAKMREVFGTTPAESRSVVSRNPKLQDILDGLDLLRFL